MRDAINENDCAVRALCQVLDLDYWEVYNAIYQRSGVLTDVILRYARQFAEVMQIKTPARTLGQFTTLCPKGRYLVFQPRHVVAVIDGRALDWAQYTRKQIVSVWRITMSNPLATAAEEATTTGATVTAPPTTEPEKPAAPKRVKYPNIPEGGLEGAVVPADFDPKKHQALRESDFKQSFDFWTIKFEEFKKATSAKERDLQLKLSEATLYRDLPGLQDMFSRMKKAVAALVKTTQDMAPLLGSSASQDMMANALNGMRTQMSQQLGAAFSTEEHRQSIERLLDNVVTLVSMDNDEA